MAKVKATPEKVIAVALSYEGYLEKKSNAQLDDFKANAGSANFTKFARDLDAIPNFYNGKKNGFPWCDVFVDWLFVHTFGVENAKKLLCQPDKSLGAGCGYSARYYDAKGQFHKQNPKPGDQIFFLDSAGDVAHTGLVYKVDNLYVYTIEGNTSSTSGVVANGGGVWRKQYAIAYNRIYGYGRPDYDSVTYDAPETEKVEQTPVTSVKAKDPAMSFLKTLSGTYKVTASALNVRHGAGTNKAIMVTIPRNTSVKCYGYYSTSLGAKWLYVAFTYKGVSYQGFCHSGYLLKA